MLVSFVEAKVIGVENVLYVLCARWQKRMRPQQLRVELELKAVRKVPQQGHQQ
jgi:hypothetical protein